MCKNIIGLLKLPSFDVFRWIAFQSRLYQKTTSYCKTLAAKQWKTVKPKCWYVTKQHSTCILILHKSLRNPSVNRELSGMIINHVTKERDRLYVIWNNFLARFFDDFWILNKCIKVLINWNKLDLNCERLTSGNIACKTWYREMFCCHQCVAGSLLVTSKFASTVYTWVYNESCADRLDICLLPRKKICTQAFIKTSIHMVEWRTPSCTIGMVNHAPLCLRTKRSTLIIIQLRDVGDNRII